MIDKTVCLAFDFGASSGRLIMSTLIEGKIELEEIYRFSNEPVRVGERFYWDILRLFHEMKTGLKKVASLNVEVSSIGIDTWGVDYGFLDKNDFLLGNPIHYRDNRTDNSLDKIKGKISFKEIYNKTGIQYMNFNTLYQLVSDIEIRENILKEAKSLLFMPDLFNFFLTGKKFNEYTNASTSQMLNAYEKEYDVELLNTLSIPTEILNKIIMPGSIIGNLTKEVSEEVGLPPIPVIAVGSHDTASAVAGTPLKSENSAYLICGTWCLLGMETKEPVINEKALKYNFTNEGGVDGTIRLLKNINGLWLIQELRKSWSRFNESVTFPDIIKAAENAENKSFIIDPNDKRFMNPLNMAEEIKSYCKESNQGSPKDLGEIAMAIYNGLTLEYKGTIDSLEEITGKKIDQINMVGGGIQDKLLCRLTQEKTGKIVFAGPIEASVLGNVLMQLKALGKIDSLEEGRKMIGAGSQIIAIV